MEPVKIHTYRKVFDTEYNFAFHRPLKDQCDLCTSYQNSSQSEKENLKYQYENHILNKDLSRQHKSKHQRY